MPIYREFGCAQNPHLEVNCEGVVNTSLSSRHPTKEGARTREILKASAWSTVGGGIFSAILLKAASSEAMAKIF